MHCSFLAGGGEGEGFASRPSSARLFTPLSLFVFRYKELRALLLMEPIGRAQAPEPAASDTVQHPHLLPVMFEVLNRAEPLCQVVMLRDLMRLLHSASSQSHRNRVLLRSYPGWSRWILELITRSYDRHPEIVLASQAAAQTATEALAAQHAAKLEAQRAAAARGEDESQSRRTAPSSTAPSIRTNKESGVYDALLDPSSDVFDQAQAEEIQMQLNILTSTNYPARVRFVGLFANHGFLASLLVVQRI